MTDETPPPPEIISAMRDQAFDEIVRVSTLAESYARSLAEAAYRGDQTTVLVHAKQLRLCCLALIKTYKESLEAKPNGEDRRGDGADQ